MMVATSVYPPPEMALGSAAVTASSLPDHGLVAPPEVAVVPSIGAGPGGENERRRADTEEQSSISLDPYSAASPHEVPRPVMPEPAPSELTLDSSLDAIGSGVASELASARIKEGLCPTCGTRLYKFRRTATRKPGVSFVKRMLDKTMRGRTASTDGPGPAAASAAGGGFGGGGAGGGAGCGPEENEGEGENNNNNNNNIVPHQHLPAPATSGGVLAAVPGGAIPLTIEGEVVRGQCVKCSGAGAAAAAASLGIGGNGIAEEAEAAPDTVSSLSLEAAASQQRPADANASQAPPQTVSNVPMAESYTLVPAAVACTYEGQKDEAGRFHGYGELRWDNGDRYAGMFWNGLRDGEGSLFFGDGTEYVGEWRLNKMCGAGTRRYANGNVFTGQYRAGRRHGQGRLYYTNGDLYDGEWRDDEIHGFGRFHYNTGRKFEGNFRNGKREGRGKYQYADGRVDIYRYKADRHVGEGVRWSKDRKKAWRLWEGKCKERVALEAAARIAERCGRVVDYEM